MVDEDAVAMAFAAPKPVLPFAGRLSPFAKPSVAAPSAPQPAPDEDERDGVTTEARIVTPRRDAAPAWLPVAAAAAVPHVAPTPNVVGAPAVLPPRPPLVHTPPPAHLPPASIQPLGWPSEPLAPPSPAPPGMRSPASLYDASTTAAGEAPPRLSPSEVAPPSVSGSSLSPRALVELVWYDPTRIGAVRKVPAWEPLLAKQPALAALTSTPPPLKDPDAESDAAEKAQRERADIQLVLGRATPTTNVEAALFDAAAEDGSLVAPLVVTAGELELGLDEVKMLEAMIGAAAAFAPGDKKLKEVVDLASEMMKTPLGASPVVAGGLVASVRDAWTRSSRLLPPDYLDVNTRRLLLEQRSYQTRGLWGDSYIRGVLFSPSNSGAGSVPTYLPAAIAKQLPLFARFPVRIVAEIFPQQDQLEASPVALRAVALGRVVQSRANR
jgi:hypothetical protein